MSFFGNALGGNPFATPVGSRIGNNLTVKEKKQ